MAGEGELRGARRRGRDVCGRGGARGSGRVVSGLAVGVVLVGWVLRDGGRGGEGGGHVGGCRGGRVGGARARLKGCYMLPGAVAAIRAGEAVKMRRRRAVLQEWICRQRGQADVAAALAGGRLSESCSSDTVALACTPRSGRVRLVGGVAWEAIGSWSGGSDKGTRAVVLRTPGPQSRPSGEISDASLSEVVQRVHGYCGSCLT